jgi:hypothetical protein
MPTGIVNPLVEIGLNPLLSRNGLLIDAAGYKRTSSIIDPQIQRK